MSRFKCKCSGCAHNLDTSVEAELVAAGIEPTRFEVLRRDSDVGTSVFGSVGPWLFRRARQYWVAEGPGIPPEDAQVLHSTHGECVRVDGNCTCPAPGNFGVGLYHVDTEEGLKALADLIREIDGRGR